MVETRIACAVVLCAAGIAAALGITNWADGQAIGATPVAIADETEDPICVLLRLIEEVLCDDVVALVDGFTGAVDRATWDELEPLIDSAITDLETILDPLQAPSLSPPSAGSGAQPIDTSNTDTDVIAGWTCERARAALIEHGCIGNPAGTAEAVGTHIRQVVWMLEDLYDQANPG